MRTKPKALLASVLYVLVFSVPSWACSCLHKASCGLHRYGDSDFVGQVLSVRIEPSNGSSDPNRVLYQVRVLETFRGSQRVGDTVTVRTGFGGGDCGYRFNIGSKYLVDASKRGDSYATGICFLTAPAEESEVELRTLRELAAGKVVPDLTGVLLRGTENSENGETVAPLAGVPVEAKPEKGAILTTSTDSFGAFTFSGLSEGRYQLVFGLPANLSASHSNAALIDENDIPVFSVRQEDGVKACYVNIVVAESGRISGTVTFPNGTTVEGWVNADTVAADDTPWNTVRTAVPEADGKFILSHLKAGRYSVQFTSRKGFVKGTRQLIDLKDGERRKDVALSSQ